MSRTSDILDADFPHGTVDGYRRGCHGSLCGAVIACRDVYRRYQGDYSFRKQIDAGMTLAEIDAQDAAVRAEAHERDKAAARAERRRLAEETRPKRAPRAPREPRVLAIDRFGPDIARLHEEGKTTAEIADALGLSRPYVQKLRSALGLAANNRSQPRAPREHKPRHDRRPDVARLHADGLNDREVGAELGIAPVYAATLRRDLGLQANLKPRARKPRPVYQPRYDRRPDVAAAHAEGLSDREIGERLGISHSEVGRLRRDLGLPAHPSGRTGGRKATLGHGTNACYARGCRRDECVEAHKQYHRDYDSRRRAAGIANGIPAEHHGTPYGYQLGCRARKNCPGTLSCTDAMLEEDRRRRRAAGVPEAAPRVPAEPVREHVRSLIDSGRSVLAIAEEAGVSKSGLKTLLYGRSGERKGEYPANIEADKAERLLALGEDGMSDALFDLEDFAETKAPEWEPVYKRWGMDPLERAVRDELCRDCGRKAGFNQGGSDQVGIFMVCDDCATLDRCLSREHDRGPEWHVSHWGDSHRADEHDKLIAAQAKRRATYLRRAAA